MGFGFSIDRSVEARQCDVDVFGVGLAEKLAAAMAAKVARTEFRTLEIYQILRPRGDPHTLRWDAAPGNETRAMGSTAHGTMTVCAKQRR